LGARALAMEKVAASLRVDTGPLEGKPPRQVGDYQVITDYRFSQGIPNKKFSFMEIFFMKNQTTPFIFGIVIFIMANAVGGGSPSGDNRTAQEVKDSMYLCSHQKKWPTPVNQIKYAEFHRKTGLFLCKKFNVSPEKAFLDPRFQSVNDDESLLDCQYRTIDADKRLVNNVGDAIGTYFYEIKNALKAEYKVGEYQIEMMVDTDGYVAKVNILKDTFNDNELTSLMIDMCSGLYFMPIGGTTLAKLSVSVTTRATPEKHIYRF
jgi:hypothetical protein